MCMKTACNTSRRPHLLEASYPHLLCHDTAIKNLIIRPPACFISGETCLLCGPRRAYQTRHVSQTGIDFLHTHFPLLYALFTGQHFVCLPSYPYLPQQWRNGHCMRTFGVVKHCYLLVQYIQCLHCMYCTTYNGCTNPPQLFYFFLSILYFFFF